MEKRWLIVKQQKKVCISKKWVISISASLLRRINETAFGSFKHQDVCLNQGAPHKLSPWLHPPPPFFFSPRPCLLFSCPTQWGRILLVAMTSVQCLYEMHPLTVWTAGQDRDTSRFKEKLLSGTAGRGTQTPRSVSNPDPVSWNGTFSRVTEVQRETLDGGVTGQCWSCRSASLDWSVHLWVRTAWMCLFRRERGGWKLRERSSWLQNGLRSMNPIGGLGWFLLLLTCLWLQWWALLMWWETAGSFYPCVLFNYNFLALSLSQEF